MSITAPAAERQTVFNTLLTAASLHNVEYLYNGFWYSFILGALAITIQPQPTLR